MSGQKTISLVDQLRASRKMYEAALDGIDQMSDAELRVVLDRMPRVLDIASDSTLARVLGAASRSTLARVLDTASGSTLARLLDTASDGTLDRVLGVASRSTLDRMLGAASDSTLARIQVLRGCQIPIVPDLDKRIAEQTDAGNLDMRQWHCGTTHCRAGWAITLAGSAGQALEEALGSEVAARLIYESSTGRPAPNFYASNSDAIADIRRCAAEAA